MRFGAAFSFLLIVSPAYGWDLQASLTIQDLPQIEAFLEEVPTGARVVEALRARHQPFETKALEKSSENLGLWDLNKNTLFLRETQMGIMAVTYLHEAVHILDEQWTEVARASEKVRLNVLQSGDVKVGMEYLKEFQREIFRAERRAYDSQANVVAEWSAKDPGVGSYFREAAERQALLAKRPSDAEILEMYRLNPEWVNEH